MAKRSSEGGQQNRRDRILDAAVRLISRNGYDGTSVRDIADEAGVTWSLVRFYFGSKDGLRDAAETYVTETYLDMVKAGNRFASFEELNEIIEARTEGLHDIVSFLRRGIVEQRPFTLEFFRNLLTEAATRPESDSGYIRDESIPADPVRELGTSLGYIMIAPQIETILGRNLFSVEEVKRRNAYSRRVSELIKLGLEAERKRKA